MSLFTSCPLVFISLFWEPVDLLAPFASPVLGAFRVIAGPHEGAISSHSFRLARFVFIHPHSPWAREVCQMSQCHLLRDTRGIPPLQPDQIGFGRFGHLGTLCVLVTQP